MRIVHIVKVLLPVVLAMTANAQTKPTIVLVHGAFADAAGWSDVIARLQKRGYNVIAVENGLTGLPADVATTKRLVDAQTGDVVLVGHSYGGAVISGASAGDPKVKALVFVAAFAPDANEPVKAVGGKFPQPALNASSRAMQGGTATAVAGGSAIGVAYLLDGATHNNPYDNLNLPFPFPDALQEFRVETSTTTANNGMHSSASVSVVTKSGTNLLHGDLFEFVRNHRFNATNPFNAINPPY